MSLSWIKVRSHLKSDPKVICIAEDLKLDRYAVIGRVVAFWAWADEFSVDGNALVVTSSFIDEEFSCLGFASALRKVGWLSGQEGNLTIPNFAKHMGKSAKSRALTKERVGFLKIKKKEGEGNDAIVTPSSSLSHSSVLDGGVQGRKAPTLAEWTEFCRGAHPEWNPKDIDSAWQHFQSQGWKRGRTRIADWRAAAEKCHAGWKELGSQGKITPPPPWDGADGPPGWQEFFKKQFPPDQFPACPRHEEKPWRDVPRDIRADLWRDMTKGVPRG